MISGTQFEDKFADMATGVRGALRFLVSRLYTPSHLKVAFADFYCMHSKVTGDDETNHLRLTMDWLRHATGVNGDGGVSAGYHFRRGWLPSYPETTGYLIPTFLKYYHLTRIEEYLNLAIRMAEWLISIQLRDGAFQGGFVDEAPKPIVFNTGQVLHGLVNIYMETRLERYLKAAVRAAEWLISIQDKDGAWRTFTYNNIPHVYKTRVSWPLLELHKLTSNKKYLDAASKNIEWALGNQDINGWFRNNAFDSKTNPSLHTIAYAIEGLLECASLTRDEGWLEAAIKPAQALLGEFKPTGTLSGVYDNKWKGTVKYRCLVGEAQMCVCWLRLFQLTGDSKWRDAAQNVSINLKRLQNTTSDNKGIRGGVKGSHPIWGDYLPFAYPNWAAKFFADALMLENKLIASACA